jgi:site-specific DNA-methyltransferase (adenine-specific)
MLPINSVHQGDCLELMKLIADKSIDMILCDLPYGSTRCAWDTIIPLDPLWAQYKRIIKDRGAIVLTSQQPFSSMLVTSNPKWYRHEWIWEKNSAVGFLNSNRAPLRAHENILVFGKKGVNYYPVKTKGEAYSVKYRNGEVKKGFLDIYSHSTPRIDKVSDGYRYPRSVLKFNSVSGLHLERGLHPTQKPIALFEYFIKTYSQPGQLILDNCAGSGTTAIACLNTGRDYLLMEQDPHYFEVINKRISDHRAQ